MPHQKFWIISWPMKNPPPPPPSPPPSTTYLIYGPLDLVKQKGLYPYEYLSDFEKIEEKLPCIEKLYSSLTDRKTSEEVYEHVMNVWNKSENNKRLSRLAFKMWCFSRCI